MNEVKCEICEKTAPTGNFTFCEGCDESVYWCKECDKKIAKEKDRDRKVRNIPAYVRAIHADKNAGHGLMPPIEDWRIKAPTTHIKIIAESTGYDGVEHTKIDVCKLLKKIGKKNTITEVEGKVLTDFFV